MAERKVYDILGASRGSSESSTSTATMNELNYARAEKVKAWIDANFSDFLECEIVEATATSTSTSPGIMSQYQTQYKIYFKNTKTGILITEVNTAGATSSSNWYNYIAVISSGTVVNSAYSINNAMFRGFLRLMIIKTKYGIIMSCYNIQDGFSKGQTMMEIKQGDKLIPLFFSADGQTIYATNVETDTLASCGNLKRAMNDECEIVLSQISIPFLNEVLDGVYYSSGYNVDECRVFDINGTKYVDLPNADYNSFALKFEG